MICAKRELLQFVRLTMERGSIMAKWVLALLSAISLLLSVTAAAGQDMPPVVRGFQVSEIMPEESESKTFQNYSDARAWGANVIRLQMRPMEYARGVKKDFWSAWPLFLDSLEKDVRLAQKAGLKVVPVFMEGPGIGAFGATDFWQDPGLTVGYQRMWRDVAERLLPYHDVIWGYDMVNEPLDRHQLPNPPREWRPLAISIMQAIRSVDQRTWLIYEVGPGTYFSGFQNLTPLPDPRVIYSAHFYYPLDFTHQGIVTLKGTPLAEAIKSVNFHYPGVGESGYYDKSKLESLLEPADAFQRKWHVPIYVGEFSVVRWAPKADAVRWLQDVVDIMEERGWSWTYHAFRESNLWSLEHDESYWVEGMPGHPMLAPTDTDRAKVIKRALSRNWQ